MQINIVELCEQNGCLASTVRFITGDQYDYLSHYSFQSLLFSLEVNSRPAVVFCTLQSLETNNEHIKDLKKLERYKQIISFVIVNDLDDGLTHTVTSMLNEVDLPGLNCIPHHFSESKINEIMTKAIDTRNRRTALSGYTKQAEPELTRQRLLAAMVNREFYPAYQPQFNLETGEYEGVEVLGRLKVAGAYIQPDSFIPLLTKYNLIDKFTVFLLSSAIRELQEHNLDEKSISINVEYHSFQRKDFAKQLTETCVLYGYPINQLTIELTETNPIHSFSLYANIYDIKKQGARVSIDDFGAGNQSLHEVKKISIDEIKLDKDYLLSIEEQPNNKQIITSIIDMSKKLGVSCVVEGVETLEHVNLLKKAGAILVQGYYFSKPISATSLACLYASDNNRAAVSI